MRKNNIAYSAPPVYQDRILWSDKKRPFLNWPLSFTRYTLYADRLVVDYGILFRRQQELRLYRVKDTSVVQGPFQRLVGVGNVRLISGDATTPNCLLVGIKNPQDFRFMLSNLVESERNRVRVGMYETFDF